MLYADIIFFAALAVFIFYKLFQVLGQKDGTEDRMKVKREQLAKQQEERAKLAPPRVKALPEPRTARSTAKAIPEPQIEDKDVAKTLIAMAAADSNFTPGHFVEGAKAAFEMVVKAYSSHDHDVLKDLLAKDVREGFEDAIKEQEVQGNREEIFVVKMHRAEFVEASLRKSHASITIEFETDQIHVTKDKEGALVSGNASQVVNITDRWVFERDLKSSNPNWMVAAT